MIKVEDYIRLNNPGMEARVLRHPAKLKEVIQKHVASPARILEIGTFVGATTMRLLDWFPDATVHTVNVSAKELEAADKNLRAVGLRSRALLHLGDSLQVLEAMLCDCMQFDVIIVDGLHTAERVQAETKLIERILKQRPCLVIYDDTDRIDYNLPKPYDGSYKNFSWRYIDKDGD
jgi:predicted O-methyltransferase YrrM